MHDGPEYWTHLLDDLDEDESDDTGPHLISVDELRAAGALDVPAEWRKSLANESRYTLPGFGDHEGADVQNDSEIDDVDDDLEDGRYVAM